MPCSGLITVLPLLEDIRHDADFYESCGWILAVNRTGLLHHFFSRGSRLTISLNGSTILLRPTT
ncbi:MAG: hypothetical protein WB975_13185, partial [Nitrososphaeraceae archaeon]